MNEPQPMHRILQLLAVDRARLVLVEMVKDELPVLDVLPEARELRNRPLVEKNICDNCESRTSSNSIVPDRSVS